MSDEDRFKDNNNGTLTDTKYNLTWTKEDSYQMRKKWCSWKGANNYIGWLNEQNFAGFNEIPPVSKHTPFPTKARGFFNELFFPFHSNVTKYVSLALP